MTQLWPLLLAAANAGDNTLLVADENCLDLPFAALAKTVAVLTNRVDIATRAQAAGLATAFSDFDFSPWRQTPPARIVYRLSKEKAVVHHIANQAAELLPTGGSLQLFGAKQEGIKTFAKAIGQRLGSSADVRKEGHFYRVALSKQTPGAALDDKHYPQLRAIAELAGKPLLSKPGTFGWDKIDAGSALLANFLPQFLSDISDLGNKKVLDLGCGYGYLSLRAAQLADCHITATDNCAAALLACAENFRSHSILNGQVIAADCGDTLTKGFDIILCNPPFHQGFQQERALTEKFLAATKRLLAPGGQALFVVNQFVPLEALGAGIFPRTSTLLVQQGFKLVVLG